MHSTKLIYNKVDSFAIAHRQPVIARSFALWQSSDALPSTSQDCHSRPKGLLRNDRLSNSSSRGYDEYLAMTPHIKLNKNFEDQYLFLRAKLMGFLSYLTIRSSIFGD